MCAVTQPPRSGECAGQGRACAVTPPPCRLSLPPQAATSGESSAVAAALAPFDDLLARYVAPPAGGGAAAAAIAYTPQALTDAGLLLPLPRAAAPFAGDGAAAVTQLCFRSPAATTAASTLYDSLYEAALRARGPALTTAPGLAAALLETAGHRRGAPCVRSERRPAAVVWSAVLAVRLLEVRCGAQCWPCACSR